METDDLPAEPTLSDVHAMVLKPACANAGCHDDDAAGQLDLSTIEASREALLAAVPINKLAVRSGWLRVAPGDLDRSFLYRKITQPGLGEGAPMPIGLRLTDPYVQLIARWIEDGAP